MDADATSELRKRGLAATDDSAKFVWHKVRAFDILCIFFVLLVRLIPLITCLKDAFRKYKLLLVGILQLTVRIVQSRKAINDAYLISD